MNKPCTRCGEMMFDVNINRLYCERCRKRVSIEQTQKYHNKRREIRCKLCGERFEGIGQVKYCNGCKEILEKETQYKREHFRYVDKPCKQCGAMMRSVTKNRIYCDDCGEKRAKGQRWEYYGRKKKESEEFYQEISAGNQYT